MLTVLRDRTYRHLYLAQVIALTGTGLATVAIALLAYDIAGADAGRVLGAALTIKMVAYVAVAPLAAALFSRLPRRRVLVGADTVRLVAALCLPFVSEIWQIYVLIAVMQAASATFTPAFQAIIPSVLPDEEDYTRALSLSRVAYDLEAVLSPLLAALLLLVVSSSTLFFGTAAGFLGSALLVVSLVLPRADVTAEDGAQSPLSKRVLHGVRMFMRSTPLRGVMALNLAVAAAGAYVLVQTVVIVRGSFGLGEDAVAVALAANGLGSLLTALIVPRLVRGFGERRVMLTSAVALVVAMAAVPAALNVNALPAAMVAVCALWFVVGVGWAGVETPVGRVIAANTRPADHPAAFAAQFSLSHACWLLTYPLAGVLGIAIGLSRTAWVLGALATAATVVAAALWRPAGDRVRDETNRSVAH